jgi:hypothetical protein
MKHWIAALAVLAGSVMPVAGCFPGDRGFLAGAALTGLVAAAIISSTPPPPPRVVYVPPPRPGYVWQPGYWIMQDGQWVWVDGEWVPQNPGYRYVPPHWEQQADGNWRFAPGKWVPLG